MTLEQFLSGVTDRDEVIVDRQGLNSIPAGDIDWIIDIGPAGGKQGGMIVAEGKPEEVAEVKESQTALFLKEKLDEARQNRKNEPLKMQQT